MNTKFIMKRKTDGKFFVKKRPDTGLGVLVTDDPNKAAIYNHDNPFGGSNVKELWEAVGVRVIVVVA